MFCFPALCSTCVPVFDVVSTSCVYCNTRAAQSCILTVLEYYSSPNLDSSTAPTPRKTLIKSASRFCFASLYLWMRAKIVVVTSIILLKRFWSTQRYFHISMTIYRVVTRVLEYPRFGDTLQYYCNIAGVRVFFFVRRQFQLANSVLRTAGEGRSDCSRSGGYRWDDRSRLP